MRRGIFGSGGKSDATKRRWVHSARRRRSGSTRGRSAAMPSSRYRRQTGPWVREPETTSSLMRRNPSLITICSVESCMRAIDNHLPNTAASTVSRLPGEAGSASTAIVPGSNSAVQMSVAPAPATSGFSAKVEPPYPGGATVPSRTRHLARARIPVDISGVAAQPFPCKCSPVDPCKGMVMLRIEPSGLESRLRGNRLPRCPEGTHDTFVTKCVLRFGMPLIG